MKELIALLVVIALAGWALFINALWKIRTMKKQMKEMAGKVEKHQQEINKLQNLHNNNQRQITALQRTLEGIEKAWKRLDKIDNIIKPKPDEDQPNT